LQQNGCFLRLLSRYRPLPEAVAQRGQVTPLQRAGRAHLPPPLPSARGTRRGSPLLPGAGL